MKLPYSEGSVFLVPLKKGGYVRGVVARMSPRGKILFGYFFSPRLTSSESVPLNDLDPKCAVARLMCGDLGFLNGDWKICGEIKNWDRSKWSMPDFITRIPHPKTGKVWITRYADNDPSKVILQVPAEPNMEYPVDSVSGQGAVEIKLDKII